MAAVVRRTSADPDTEFVRVVVTAIALVDMDAAGLDAGESFHLGHDRAEGMAVEGIAVQRFGVEHELAALWLGDRRCDRHFASELVGHPRLALADAFDLGGVQRIDLGAALAVVLVAHLDGEIEEMGEAGLERGIAVDLAVDVTDDAAEPCAQELECAAGALELVRMDVAAHHDRGALGDPRVALP